MCGLIFLYRNGLSDSHGKEQARQALAKIAHRGPDDSNIITSENVVIGHQRLAIIDLHGSRQPMRDPSGRFSLAYNGEIYNFMELRKSLASHWKFQTSGDTEVILAGLSRFGEDFLTRMEGMWALAFWDGKMKKLLLSRDRMGKKPLFYYSSPEGLACASELPAIKVLIGTPLQEDLDSTADYLRYGYYLPGYTAYRDVYEVLPGNVLTWMPGSSTNSRSYWSLKLTEFRGTKNEAQECLREVLIRSVKRRMVADVEVAAFLSGGVDSSLITAIMSQHCGITPKTFTIGFSEKSYDERVYARQIADKFNTDHYVQCLSEWNSDKLKSLVLEHVGQPFADSSLLPTSMVSELASKYVKVALSGDGGDELFSGYQRYQARAILRWYTRLPRCIRQTIKKLVTVIPEPMSHHSGSILKKTHLFLDIVDRLEDETPYVAPLMYCNAQFEQLAPDLKQRGHSPPLLPEETNADDLKAMMTSDALIYLPQDILTKVDRASMAYSLETRAPFLDREVVELAFSMPRHWHRRGMSGKRMLRESFGHLLPETIWSRRKQGFGVPIHKWFRQSLGVELEGLLASNQSPISAEFVRSLLSNHRQGKRDHGYRLWNIYIYLLWNQSEKHAC